MDYTYSSDKLQQLKQLSDIEQEYRNAIYHLSLIAYNMRQEQNQDWILSYTEMLWLTNPLKDLQNEIWYSKRLTLEQKEKTPLSVYKEREDWFMKHIWKRIYRNHICPCKSCSAIDEHWLIVQDKLHASYLCTVESDYSKDWHPVRYVSKEDFNPLTNKWTDK